MVQELRAADGTDAVTDNEVNRVDGVHRSAPSLGRSSLTSISITTPWIDDEQFDPGSDSSSGCARL